MRETRTNHYQSPSLIITMAYLNFNENYNGKLYCNLFTTIRSNAVIAEKNLSVGDNVEIQINHVRLCYAKVLRMESISLSHPTASQRILLSLDTGMEWTIARTLLHDMYGENELVCVLLQTI